VDRGGREDGKMKKLVAIVVVLAVMLVAAVPAFAQTAIAGSVQFVDCDQIQAAIGQYQNAEADDFSAVSQSLSVDQNQVLACSESVAAGRDITLF
jgi:predicted secreted protein